MIIERHGFFGGVAANLSVARDCTPRELSVSHLQDVLGDEGVDLSRAGGSVEYPSEATRIGVRTRYGIDDLVATQYSSHVMISH
jgi:hypothetical protein